MMSQSKIMGVLQGVKSNALSLGITFVATNIIKDRLLALGSLAMIGLKKGIETLTNYRFADLTKHDVSDEDLENMKQVFEQLQNQYLQESGFDPIKIGDEWLNLQIEIPPIQTLSSEIDTIVEQNKTYNETKTAMIDAIVDSPSEPAIQPEPIIEPTSVYDYEPLTEEEQKIFNELTELKNYFIKLENEDNYIITPFPDLPSTEPISGSANRPIVPDIEKDIKDAKQSSILDIPDVDDVSIQQNTDRRQDLKPNEIKNKMEL
jgi:hypothetical protein